MRIKTLFLSLIIFGCCASLATAQNFTLSGKVVDTDSEPIPFANILLLNTDKVLIFGAVTAEDGSFLIENMDDAAYQLRVSFVGYEDYITDAFSLASDEVLPTIVLQSSSENLEEVTIVGKKPTVTRKSDRLVFNVENTILSSGNTFDILKNTPGVIVNQDDISIRNEGATVYLNDRKVQLSSSELKDLLESMDGVAIKSIEVITNPPAKYEAEGGAILNIVTNKAIATGYKGNVKTVGTYAVFPKYSFGTTHYFKNDKVNLFFNYNYSPRKSYKTDDGFTNFKNNNEDIASWLLDYRRTTRSQAHTTNLVFDYQLTEKQSLSFAVNGFYSPDIKDNFRSLSTIDSSIEDDFSINTLSDLNSDQSNLAFDANYELAIGNGKLSLNGHYTTFARDRGQNLSSDYRDAQDAIFQNVSFSTAANQDIEIYTGQVDFENKLGELYFEAGAKVAAIDSQSKIDFFDVNNTGENGLDQASSDNFLYDENVIAGYFSLSREWEKWSLKGGLRAEQTNSKGTSLVLNVINELDYLEWFPSAYIGYQAGENHSLAFDYGRKLERPRYQDLNPFAYFLNENNFNIGNPNLLPSFNHRFNFNYTYKGAYSFDVYYRDNGENLLTLAFQDNELQIYRTERQNAMASTSYGIDFTHGRNLVKGWYFYTYMSLFHEEEVFMATESGNQRVSNAIDGFFVQLYNSLNLSADRSFSGEVTFAYLSKFLSGSYVQDPTTNLSVGLRKSFWNKRAVLAVTGNDLLGKANAQVVSRYLNQDNGYLAIPETQNVQISLTYNFGNFRLKDNNRDLDKEERSRLSGE